jgi:acyl-coenzyme A synthetase/AMP-(fatty) acid ligase
VFACVVLKRKVPDREAAMALFQHCYERLAYYKAPGWIHVVDTLPTTGNPKNTEAQHISGRR